MQLAAPVGAAREDFDTPGLLRPAPRDADSALWRSQRLRPRLSQGEAPRAGARSARSSGWVAGNEPKDGSPTSLCPARLARPSARPGQATAAALRRSLTLAPALDGGLAAPPIPRSGRRCSGPAARCARCQPCALRPQIPRRAVANSGRREARPQELKHASISSTSGPWRSLGLVEKVSIEIGGPRLCRPSGWGCADGLATPSA